VRLPSAALPVAREEASVPYYCPECGARSLNVSASLELPPDSRSDEITLQTARCDKCGFSAISVYEESRRGSWDSESIDHRGFPASVDELQAIEKTIRRCPRPRDRRCECAAHRSLGVRDARGRWCGLLELRGGAWFPIRI
jgi:hypothetical protein